MKVQRKFTEIQFKKKIIKKQQMRKTKEALHSKKKIIIKN